MQFVTHIKESFSNLIHAKMRSFLAILGILVGTASVVALISSSKLATQHAISQFKTLGTNLLSMDVSLPFTGFTQKQSNPTMQLKESDVYKLLTAAPQLQSSAPYISLFNPIRFKGAMHHGEVLAVTKELASIVKLHIKRGRFVSYLDKNSYFCMIGSKLAASIRASGFDPLGQQIMVGNRYFTVVGILKKWHPNLFIYADINNGVLIPLQAAYLLSSQAQIRSVLFRLVKNPNLNLAEKHITSKMTVLLPALQVRFRNPQQIIDIVGKQRKTFTWLLASIGGISLLVGGIGVMNIMLVSVVERRREIGIRMAIGAKQADILMMFLIESIILTIFGGIVGIILGVLISLGIAELSHWGFELFWGPIILGFMVSVLVGVLSGFYPALNASRLDPIQSLGTE